MHIIKYVIKIYFLFLLLTHQSSYSSNKNCVEIVKNSPSEYQLYINCDKPEFDVELKQRFNKDWRVFLVSKNYDGKKINIIKKIDIEDIQNNIVPNNILIEISDKTHIINKQGFNEWKLENKMKYLVEKNKILIIYYPELIYTSINNILIYFIYVVILATIIFKGISWQKKRR